MRLRPGGCEPQCRDAEVYAAGDGAPVYRTELGGRLIVLPERTVSGFVVHREVYVPETGSIDFVRYADIIENRGMADRWAGIRLGTAQDDEANDLGSTPTRWSSPLRAETT